jgi:hypothetical protein
MLSRRIAVAQTAAEPGAPAWTMSNLRLYERR